MSTKIDGKDKRAFGRAKAGKPGLGPLSQLPGDWVGRGKGWNMIALPWQGAPPPGGFRYRILMNQYDEDLSFSFVDNNVPNRGLHRNPNFPATNTNAFDQKVATLDYQQHIKQTIATDFPVSPHAGPPGLDIHHEPGLFLFMKNLRTNGLNIARLASIPHGNTILGLGKSERVRGLADIPPINGLPFGRFEDMTSGDYDFKTDPYLAPYKHFVDNPFMGNVVGVPGFPGFQPLDMTEILRWENRNINVRKTTVLTFDTKVEDAAVVNIPFAVKQAEPVSMRSIFWIQEYRGRKGRIRLRMQYAQIVMLNFFSPREDQQPGRATWPHVSINTLEKVVEKEDSYKKLIDS